MTETIKQRAIRENADLLAAYDQATGRVSRSTALSEYREILCDYDWPEGAEHLLWVATAPEAEVLDWAAEIARQEAQAYD